jgi:8-oxo-dGTP diphosphatase
VSAHSKSVLPEKRCKEAARRQPPAAPAVIEILARGVCVRDGYLLLCRNRKRGNVYLPGGHVEWGESAQAALEREIREELNIVPRVGRFIGVCEAAFVQEGRRVCELNLCFQMTMRRARPPEPPAVAEPKLEFFWVPLRRVRQSALLPEVLRNKLVAWLRHARHAACHWASNMPASR